MKSKHLTYWADLQGITFEEHKPNSAWMQAFPIGSYDHAIYGKIVMTFDRAKAMASNVIQKVRGIDIAIDYGHDSAGKAAGWVSSAEARPDGLWLFVDWTNDAADDIRSGKFRYFSPEFINKWKHPESGATFTDVLIGGGLTNRPFLKTIMPVNLSDILEKDPSIVGLLEGGDMEKFLEKLRTALKLSEDTDEDAIMEAFTKALQANTEEDPDGDPAEALSEAEVAKILVEHPAMAGVIEMNKTLSEANKTLAGRVVNLELTGRSQTVNVKLAEWHAGGEDKKYGLPTALDEKIAGFMLSATTEQVSAFEEIVDALVKTGLVPLGEPNLRRGRKKISTTVLSEVEEGIKKLMDEDDDLTYADASTQLFRENEDLYEAYLEEAMTEEVDV